MDLKTGGISPVLEQEGSYIIVACDAKKLGKAPTLEEVRGILADKASSGHREAVQALIQRYGAKRLSDIAPSEFEALIQEARAIK